MRSFHFELIKNALPFVGVREEGGPNKGVWVEIFQKAADGKAQGEPWCMSFVQYCVKQAAKQLGILPPKPFSDSADTEHCMTAWNKTPAQARYKEPKPGLIVIWKKGSTQSGHTGIVVAADLAVGLMLTIEGNTGPDSSEVKREGDGVYLKTRAIKGTGDMVVVGFIDPFYI